MSCHTTLCMTELRTAGDVQDAQHLGRTQPGMLGDPGQTEVELD